MVLAVCRAQCAGSKCTSLVLTLQMPAGAISMFGPATKNLLSEGLRKRQPSTSEESEKSEEV